MRKCSVPDCFKVGKWMFGLAGVRLCSEHYSRACAGHRRAMEEWGSGPFPMPMPEDILRWALEDEDEDEEDEEDEEDDEEGW